MTFPFDLKKYPPVREIERELKKARNQLNDAIFDDDEELKKALHRQILRLELLKKLNEKFDVDF